MVFGVADYEFRIRSAQLKMTDQKFRTNLSRKYGICVTLLLVGFLVSD